MQLDKTCAFICSLQIAYHWFELGIRFELSLPLVSLIKTSAYNNDDNNNNRIEVGIARASFQ